MNAIVEVCEELGLIFAPSSPSDAVTQFVESISALQDRLEAAEAELAEYQAHDAQRIQADLTVALAETRRQYPSPSAGSCFQILEREQPQLFSEASFPVAQPRAKPGADCYSGVRAARIGRYAETTSRRLDGSEGADDALSWHRASALRPSDG